MRLADNFMLLLIHWHKEAALSKGKEREKKVIGGEKDSTEVLFGFQRYGFGD